MTVPEPHPPTHTQIIRALAAIQDPTVEDRDYAPSSTCGLCDAADRNSNDDWYYHDEGDAFPHHPECPWRQARQWVTNHPNTSS